MKKTLLLLFLTFTITFNAKLQAQVITTIAGGGVGDGGPATAAALYDPFTISVADVSTIAVDGSGNIYIADGGNYRIRKVNPSGIISTIAGNGINAYSGDGGAATAAGLINPSGVAVDGIGNVYMVDAGGTSGRIRKVSAGIITTVAGGGTSGLGDGGPATLAMIQCPTAVAVDGAGNIYITDACNNLIRKVNPSGIINTIAGNVSAIYLGDGGLATSAALNAPAGVAIDGTGNVYIADYNNHRVRMVNTSGIITTIAGNGTTGFSGDGGPAVNASLSVEGISIDGAGNLYIADVSNNRIRKVNTSGIITTIAGNGIAGYSGDGGAATAAALNSPTGVTVDGLGNVYISDAHNYRYRMINPSGIITTVAGNGNQSYSGDSIVATSAELSGPLGVVFDVAGNAYIDDYGNNRIRKVNTSGIITTIAGSVTSGYSGDGGAATSATLNNPACIAVDGAGNLYIADRSNNRIRKVDNSGVITTIAGIGTSGYGGDGSPATSATLNNPDGLAVDGSGTVYIDDYGNNRIRKVSTAGIITTIAGNGSASYSGDGGPATSASLNTPTGVAVDGAGNLYIADKSNHRIRKVNTSGIISTIAGNGSAGYSGDGGLATSASMYTPTFVTVDVAGNLYITDNCRIRKVNTSGIITTIAGNGSSGYSGDGGSATSAELNYPDGLTIDGIGNIYISDYMNNRIRKVGSSSGSAPIAHFTPSSTSIIPGTTITTTNTSTGLPTPTYSWSVTPTTGVSFSPSTTATNPSIIFSTIGTYTITLSATNTLGSNAANAVITVNPATVSVFHYPSIKLNKSTIDTGQILTITGTHFTPILSTQININAVVGSQTFNKYISVNSDSTFTYSWTVPDSFKTGTYYINATDTSRHYTSVSKSLRIKHTTILPPVSYINITSPQAGDLLYAGSIIYITWSDEMTSSDQLNTNISGYAQKTYKLEYSMNGGSWQSIENYWGTGRLDNFTTFNYDYWAPVDGSYQIKISNVANPVDYKISQTFTVSPAPGLGFDYSMEWDNSGRKPNTNPKGVCADGTARVFLKVAKKSTTSKDISKVTISISDPTLTSQDISKVGKLMAATQILTYGTEANAANAIQITNSNPVSGVCWFWYVAPDDFNRGVSSDNNLGTRKVNVSISVTYKDNSQETLQSEITIVRPPVMLVHGLASDEHAWDNFVYNDNGDKFIYADEDLGLFRAGMQLNHMLPDASFMTNADKLLNWRDPNSFQNCLNTARFGRLYATNRVDYICHSMGGSMIRTAINLYPNEYYPNSINSSIQNYERGFVNKLITINTPHNGSPEADWISEEIPQLNYPQRVLLTDNYNLFYNTLKSYVIPLQPDDLFIPHQYIPTDAVKDLQSFRGGVKFNSTSVKNHLIGGNINNWSFKDIEVDELGIVVVVAASLATAGNDMQAYIINQSPYPDFFDNSDGVVPVSSEFAGYTDFSPSVPRKVFTGLDKNHIQIVSSIDVGKWTLSLLNTQINSSLFGDVIPENLINPNPNHTYKTTKPIDSTHEYFDSIKIKILLVAGVSHKVDSTLAVTINLNDTNSLKQISLFFQGQVYTSTSKDQTQIFYITISPIYIDSQMVLASALYDSSGFDIYHYNITTIKVETDSLPRGIAVTPKTISLNPQEDYAPVVNGIHNNYITTIALNNPELTINVADTNAITFDPLSHHFIAKDSGSTYAIFTYHGLKDSLFFYVLKQDNTCYSPMVNFTSTKISGNCPLNVDFSDSSLTTGSKSWLWTFYRGTDSITSTIQNPTGIQYNTAGSFSVKLIITDGCGMDSLMIPNYITVTCPEQGDGSIHVYPNPSGDFINISSYGIQNDNYKITLINVLGQELSTSEIAVTNNTIEMQISVQELPMGIYFLRVNSSKKKNVFKVSKI